MRMIKSCTTICVVMGVFWVGVVGCALAQPIAADAKLEPLTPRYAYTEGPTIAPDGSVYFTDGGPDHRILRYDPATSEVTTVRDRDTSGGANGLAFHEGRLYVCEDRIHRRVTTTDDDGQIVVLADQYQGKRFNGPNDLAIDSSGGVYFTDPVYTHANSVEQDVEAVYYIAPNGEVSRVIDTLVKPNGIVLSPDGSRLYVADNGAQSVHAFPVLGPGVLGEDQLFAAIDFPQRWMGPDGMAVDAAGRVYVGPRGSLKGFDPGGTLLAAPGNGGKTSQCVVSPDQKTLYVTANNQLNRLPLSP